MRHFKEFETVKARFSMVSFSSNQVLFEEQSKINRRLLKGFKSLDYKIKKLVVLAITSGYL